MTNLHNAFFRLSICVIGLPWWLSGKKLKNPPANAETRVQSLGHKDPLEKEMATSSSILTWKILWTEEPGRLQSMGSQRIRHNLATKQHICNKPIFEKKTKARG